MTKLRTAFLFRPQAKATFSNIYIYIYIYIYRTNSHIQSQVDDPGFHACAILRQSTIPKVSIKRNK